MNDDFNETSREVMEDAGYTLFQDNDSVGEAHADDNYMGVRWYSYNNSIEFMIKDTINTDGLMFTTLTREDALELASYIIDIYGEQASL